MRQALGQALNVNFHIWDLQQSLKTDYFIISILQMMKGRQKEKKHPPRGRMASKCVSLLQRLLEPFLQPQWQAGVSYWAGTEWKPVALTQIWSNLSCLQSPSGCACPHVISQRVWKYLCVICIFYLLLINSLKSVCSKQLQSSHSCRIFHFVLKIVAEKFWAVDMLEWGLLSPADLMLGAVQKI